MFKGSLSLLDNANNNIRESFLVDIGFRLKADLSDNMQIQYNATMVYVSRHQKIRV